MSFSKLIKAVILIASSGLIALSVSANAQADESDKKTFVDSKNQEIHYFIDDAEGGDGGVHITGVYEYTDGEQSISNHITCAQIPAQIDGKAVTSVDVSFKQYTIVELDVSECQALTFLRTGQKINQLDISRNNNLKVLYCDDSEITTLDTSNNPELTIISCRHTKLKTLDISGKSKLTYLNCVDTNITSLDTSHNPELTTLLCSFTKLTSLDVSKNTKLKELDCSHTKISTLDINCNPELTVLSCSTTKLASLDISKNTKLIKLDCSITDITTLDTSCNPELIDILCEANHYLTSIDISKSTKLKKLDCGGANISTLDIRYNSELVSLDCRYNELTVLDVGICPRLESLLCSDNNLTSLDLSNNSHLKSLYCDNNQLTFLDVGKNHDLITLNCSNNQLTNLDVSENANLEELYCSNNQLTNLDVSVCKNLKALYCCDNSIFNLDLSNNVKLDRLEIRDNYDGYIDSTVIKTLIVNAAISNNTIYDPVNGWSIPKSVLIKNNKGVIIQDAPDDGFDYTCSLLTFDANGGTLKDYEKEMYTFFDKPLYLPVPVKSGYTCIGWFTEKDGGQQIDMNTVFDKDTTLYAHWKTGNPPFTSDFSHTNTVVRPYYNKKQYLNTKEGNVVDQNDRLARAMDNFYDSFKDELRKDKKQTKTKNAKNPYQQLKEADEKSKEPILNFVEQYSSDKKEFDKAKEDAYQIFYEKFLQGFQQKEYHLDININDNESVIGIDMVNGALHAVMDGSGNISGTGYNGYNVEIDVMPGWLFDRVCYIKMTKGIHKFQGVYCADPENVAKSMSAFAKELENAVKSVTKQTATSYYNYFNKISGLGGITDTALVEEFGNDTFLGKFGYGFDMLDKLSKMSKFCKNTKAAIDDIANEKDELRKTDKMIKFCNSENIKDAINELKNLSFSTDGMTRNTLANQLNQMKSIRDDFVSALFDLAYDKNSFSQNDFLSDIAVKWLDFKGIKIKCPVDVYVYDGNGNGNVLASIVNGKVTDSDKVKAVLNGSEKAFYFPSDLKVRIRISGTDSGTMTCCVESWQNNAPVCRKIYYDLPVTDGCTYTQLNTGSYNYVDNYSDPLLDGNKKTVAVDELILCTDKDPDVTIKVKTSGNGFVSGQGSYVKGDSVSLAANPDKDYSFDGWYEGGKLVDLNVVHQFPAKKNITLEARFSKTRKPVKGYKIGYYGKYKGMSDVGIYGSSAKNVDLSLMIYDEKLSKEKLTFIIEGLDPDLTVIKSDKKSVSRSKTGEFTFTDVKLASYEYLILKDSDGEVIAMITKNGNDFPSITPSPVPTENASPTDIADPAAAETPDPTEVSDPELSPVPGAVTSENVGDVKTVDKAVYMVTKPAADGIPGEIVYIGPDKQNNTSVSIPDSIMIDNKIYYVTQVGNNAFAKNNKLKKVKIGANITRIGKKAFFNCKSLVKVSGGKKLEIIGAQAFAKCPKLKSFSISSKTLKTIGNKCFDSDKNLKTITLKTTALTKKGVKGALAKSGIKKVKVNKNKIKAYKKVFTKKNCGIKVKVIK